MHTSVEDINHKSAIVKVMIFRCLQMFKQTTVVVVKDVTGHISRKFWGERCFQEVLRDMLYQAGKLGGLGQHTLTPDKPSDV